MSTASKATSEVAEASEATCKGSTFEALCVTICIDFMASSLVLGRVIRTSRGLRWSYVDLALFSVASNRVLCVDNPSPFVFRDSNFKGQSSSIAETKQGSSDLKIWIYNLY